MENFLYGLKYPPCKWADLPNPVQYEANSFYCPDAPLGASLVVSDGKGWRPFARGIFAGRIALTSAMGGLAKFTYTNPFVGMMPTLSVTLTDGTAEGRLSHIVTVESLTGCTVKVERGKLLPTVSTLLVGYDTFTGGNVAGIVVNLVAHPRA